MPRSNDRRHPPPAVTYYDGVGPSWRPVYTEGAVANLLITENLTIGLPRRMSRNASRAFMWVEITASGGECDVTFDARYQHRVKLGTVDLKDGQTMRWRLYTDDAGGTWWVEADVAMTPGFAPMTPVFGGRTAQLFLKPVTGQDGLAIAGEIGAGRSIRIDVTRTASTGPCLQTAETLGPGVPATGDYATVKLKAALRADTTRTGPFQTVALAAENHVVGNRSPPFGMILKTSTGRHVTYPGSPKEWVEPIRSSHDIISAVGVEHNLVHCVDSIGIGGAPKWNTWQNPGRHDNYVNNSGNVQHSAVVFTGSGGGGPRCGTFEIESVVDATHVVLKPNRFFGPVPVDDWYKDSRVAVTLGAGSKPGEDQDKVFVAGYVAATRTLAFEAPFPTPLDTTSVLFIHDHAKTGSYLHTINCHQHGTWRFGHFITVQPKAPIRAALFANHLTNPDIPESAHVIAHHRDPGAPGKVVASSASDAPGAVLGSYEFFQGTDSETPWRRFGSVTCSAEVTTPGAERGRLALAVRDGAADREVIALDTGGLDALALKIAGEPALPMTDAPPATPQDGDLLLIERAGRPHRVTVESLKQYVLG